MDAKLANGMAKRLRIEFDGRRATVEVRYEGKGETVYLWVYPTDKEQEEGFLADMGYSTNGDLEDAYKELITKRQLPAKRS